MMCASNGTRAFVMLSWSHSKKLFGIKGTATKWKLTIRTTAIRSSWRPLANIVDTRRGGFMFMGCGRCWCFSSIMKLGMAVMGGDEVAEQKVVKSVAD